MRQTKACLWVLALVAVAASAEPPHCQPADDACSEDQVEAFEAVSTSGARLEMLQLGVRLKGPQARTASGSSADLTVDSLTESIVERLEDDERVVASLQQMVHSQRMDIEQLLHKHSHQALLIGTHNSVDCAKYPMFCDSRINCAADPVSDAEKAAIGQRIATLDGHANMRSWCVAYPMYATSLQKCILEGDPLGYAREMYASQTKMNLLNADAIYCFVSGHCNNTNVTLETTPTQAEALCDARFGHEAWSQVGLDDFVRVLQVAAQFESHRGVLKEWNVTDWRSIVAFAQLNARISALTSCAMGNYHCDVSYCKANYCDNPTYRTKYGNLSWAL